MLTISRHESCERSTIKITINGETVSKIKHGETAEFTLSPGEHEVYITVLATNSPPVQILYTGESVHLECRISFMGFPELFNAQTPPKTVNSQYSYPSGHQVNEVPRQELGRERGLDKPAEPSSTDLSKPIAPQKPIGANAENRKNSSDAPNSKEPKDSEGWNTKGWNTNWAWGLLLLPILPLFMSMDVVDNEELSPHNGDEPVATQSEAATKSQPESGYIANLQASLDYPPMGTPYSDMQSLCSEEPIDTPLRAEHFQCDRNQDGDGRFKFVFGPDANLKASYFFLRSLKSVSDDEMEKADIVDNTEVLNLLDAKYGDRAVTQTGTRNFWPSIPEDVNFTAISYGCRAYFINQPGGEIVGGAPKSHQEIWNETGIMSIPNRVHHMDFEVVESEVLGSSKCVVALVISQTSEIREDINTFKTEYRTEVDVLEVDPQFKLLRSDFW